MYICTHVCTHIYTYIHTYISPPVGRNGALLHLYVNASWRMHIYRVHEAWHMCMDTSHVYGYIMTSMIKSQVSFAKEPYKRDDILQNSKGDTFV